MFLKKWDELPESIKNESVKEYYETLSRKKIQLFLKRIFDVIMSFFLLIVLSPIFLILIIWIKLDSKGPAFYRQERITKYGKVFKIFKFRTMVIDAEKKGALITTQGDPRITKVGEKIRKSRIDELPQLINILIGDMSFVGTRPEVKKYVNAYDDEMKATLLLPAGVTSLASIKFRDEDEIISKYVDELHSIDDIYIKMVLPKKMKYNLEYIHQLNLIRDFVICIKTVF